MKERKKGGSQNRPRLVQRENIQGAVGVVDAVGEVSMQ
jgi:hypothetical protein